MQFGNGERNEVMHYKVIVNLTNKQIDKEVEDHSSAFTFRDSRDHRRMNGKYKVLVEWKWKTLEPIVVMRQDNSVTLAKYGHEDELLSEPGWKRLLHYIKSTKRIDRNIKQEYIMFAARSTQCYKFGAKVPCNEKEAVNFDNINKISLWNTATGMELNQVVKEYETSRDL